MREGAICYLDESGLAAARRALEDQRQALAVRRLEDGLFAADRLVIGPHFSLSAPLGRTAVEVRKPGLVGHSFPSDRPAIGA
ncbi:hypothetical protein [Mycobacterium intracellulare]|uniref:hypothetical protein n=1 Tax=Mycobacterium intracellulare TaxID=1767 RepID=UPI003AF48359